MVGPRRTTAAWRACTVSCAAGGALVLMLVLAAPFGGRQSEDVSVGAVRQAEALAKEEADLNSHIHSNLQLLEALSHTLQNAKLRAAYRIAARTRSRQSRVLRSRSSLSESAASEQAHRASTARSSQTLWQPRSEWKILDSNRDLTGVHLSVSRHQRHQRHADPFQMPLALRSATSAWEPLLHTRFISGPDALRQVSPAAAIAVGEAAASHGLAAG